MDSKSSSSPAQLEQLAAYVQQQLHAGLQPNEVAGQLRQAGWPDSDIHDVFQKAQASIMPTTAVSNATQQTVVNQTNPSEPSRGRIRTGWLLFKQSIRVLKSDKTLTKYLVASTCYSIVLLLIFAMIFLLGHHTFSTSTMTAENTTHYNLTPLGYVLVLIYYVIAYFIVNYYSAGLAANVLDLFKGQKKQYSDYMQVARSKAGTLFAFSLIEATIGMVLRAIAERSKLLGRIIINIVGAAWSIARLFVVPVIITTDDNALKAIKDSTKLLASTWGENIVGRVSLGTIIFLIDLVILLPLSIILLIVGGTVGGGVGVVIAIIIVLLLVLVFSIVASTASSVLNVALFYYAQNKQIPAAFDANLINSFIHKKQRRGLFGQKAT
jgi:uncharacterized protein DUF6159